MLALGLAFLVKKSFSQSTTVTIDTFAGPINPSAEQLMELERMRSLM
jgi:hypothetical protein